MQLFPEKIEENARDLKKELDWFEELLSRRAEQFRLAISQKPKRDEEVNQEFFLNFPPPDFRQSQTQFGQMIQRIWEAGEEYYPPELRPFMLIAERVILALTLAPHVRPEGLDIFFFPNEQNREFTEFGGIKSKGAHQGFLPSGETALFILAGNNLSLRFLCQSIFDSGHFFARAKVLYLLSPPSNAPSASGALEISREYLQLLTTGKPYQPDYSPTFPAKHIRTKLDWEDLVLDYYTLRDVEEVRAWIKHQAEIHRDPNFNRELTGYRCLFYGPSGTGKTLTTTLLAKEMKLPVYRIDLSKVVSKYIGETEKNLQNVFEQAAYHNWILFFDEGDALFGKRTQNKSSNDRHANQEVAYLLQQIEEHPGIIILATNVRSNMDKAFLRRFQSEVYFPIPNEQSRLELWEKSFNTGLALDQEIDLLDTARRYEITGAAIKNVKHYCLLMAMDRGDEKIDKDDFREGLRKQLEKEGRKL